MRFLLIFLLLFSSVWAEESCYTVQIVSAYKTETSSETIASKSYDKRCKIMEIGKNITVRCGCYEQFSKAKSLLLEFKEEYKKAYVMSTYKSRFAPSVENKIINEKVIEPIVTPQKEKREENLTKVVKQEVIMPPATVIVEPVSNEIVIDEVATNSTSSLKKKKKKKIKIREKKIKKKKKKKKSKVKKVKYVKKQEAHYKYQRYLKRLKNKRGIRPYDYRYKFGAQISYDIAYIDTADESYFANDWRRVRLYHQGSFFDKKLFYELEYSFTGNNHYKDIFVGYEDKIKNLNTSYRVKAGNVKIPFSLDSYSSSKNITFMERALTDAFGETRKLGGELLLGSDIYSAHINLFAAGFSNSIDQRVRDEINQPGFSSRITYAQKFSKHHIVSVGGAYFSQDMKGKDVKFNESAEAKLMNKKYISASVKKVDTLSKENIEVLYIYNKYSLQAEYTSAMLRAINKNKLNQYQDYKFYGYYIQGSYFLIGSGRKYKISTATLGKIKPKIGGALEFAMRYSYLNLNDADEDNNGAQSDYNFGLNWYINRETRLMFNYIVSNPKKTKEYDGMLQIAEARLLFAF